MQDQKGSKKNIRAEEEKITAPPEKQHEDEEGDTAIRPRKKKKKKKGTKEIPWLSQSGSRVGREGTKRPYTLNFKV